MYRIARFWTGLLLAATVLAIAGMCQEELTAEEKANALQFVNHLRRSTVPRAADMNGILWDTTLENLAQKAANSCVFAHNYGGEYASLGETIYRGGNRNFTHIFMFMFLERENYDHKIAQCNLTLKYPFFSTCGHYLQIASAAVSKMGCGIQRCNGAYLGVCEFNRQYSSPPFQIGKLGTKCGNGYATYYQDGLCYAILVGQQPPIPGPFECILSCLNYGTLITSPFCSCVCPPGFFGVRCETKNPYYVSNITRDCTAQAVTCKNDGIPIMIDTDCGCACHEEFRGDNCEENINQMESSIFLHFGGQTIYQSYYPVDLTLWNATQLRNKVEKNLTSELNNYCSTNITSCCPNSNLTIETFVTSDDFHDTDNYPAQDIDGTLVAAVHYRLNATLATMCNSTSYVTKSLLLEAFLRAKSGIEVIATEVGLQLVRFS